MYMEYILKSSGIVLLNSWVFAKDCDSVVDEDIVREVLLPTATLHPSSLFPSQGSAECIFLAKVLGRYRTE